MLFIYQKTINISVFILILLMSEVLSQSITVSGRITAGEEAVKNAEVTFVNENDTTKKYSTVTDTLGNYRLEIIITGIKEENNTQPVKFELGQNYPNPFTGETAIPYNIKESAAVEIQIYNILGQEVKKIIVGEQAMGSHIIKWDGRNNAGVGVSPGIYFYRLNNEVKKMMYGIHNIGASSGFVPVSGLGKTGMINDGYALIIGNTDSTSPTIEERKITNVTFANDTVINLVVEEAEDYSLCYMTYVNDYWQICVNNTLGTHPRIISESVGDHEYPEWSPDGNYIVYSYNGSIIVYSCINRTNTAITPDSLTAGQTPEWTPDGKILFQAVNYYRESWPYEMYLINADGTEMKKIIDTLATVYFYPDAYNFVYVKGYNRVYKGDIDGISNKFLFDINDDSDEKNIISDFNPNTNEMLVYSNNMKTISTINIDTKKINVLLEQPPECDFYIMDQTSDFSKIILGEMYQSDFYLTLYE